MTSSGGSELADGAYPRGNSGARDGFDVSFNTAVLTALCP